MADINTINNSRNNHDKSINEIETTLDINWHTTKKYADSLVLPEKKLNKNGETSFHCAYKKTIVSPKRKELRKRKLWI